MAKKITYEQFLSKFNNINVTVDPSTFNGIKHPCIAFDSEFGPWRTTPKNLLNGVSHPKRMYKMRRVHNRLTIEQVMSRLPTFVTINPQDYINTHTPILAKDLVYGEWSTTINRIFLGQNHPKRAAKNAADLNRLSIEEIKLRLPEHVTFDFSTYVDVSTKVTAIDSVYGLFVAVPSDIFDGHGHPERGKDSSRQKKSLTLIEIKDKLLEYSNGEITIKEDTFTYSSRKAVFYDSKVNKEWEDLVSKVIYCKRFHPNRASSKAENEILSFINSFGYDAKKRRFNDDLGRFELDIVLEEISLAIEFCGIYWHNEKQINERECCGGINGQNYHKIKMQRAKKLGYRLITIFEDEWFNRKNQIKNFLSSIINKKQHIVYARKCDLGTVDPIEARNFVRINHIQGMIQKPLIAYGLFYENELIGVVTGNKHHRGGINSSLVLDRMCFKGGISILGGASKLFTALKEYAKLQFYTDIISWSDNRWSEGNVYVKIGFKLTEDMDQDYSYVKGNKRVSKQSKKKTAEERLTGKTELELRIEEGWIRIWDCGKKRWAYSLESRLNDNKKP